MDYLNNYNVEMEKKVSNLMVKMDRSLFCSVNMEDISNLKSGTQRLLTLLESIESKASAWTKLDNKAECAPDDSFNQLDILSKPAITKKSDTIIKSISASAESITNSVNTSAQIEVLKFNKGTINDIVELEAAARQITVIKYQKDEDTDCSVYKKLTNVCQCLNKTAYNDFVMQFYSHNSYFTNTTGEIIKNLRILKQFMYMGTTYTKNSLLFLNDGLTFSAHGEAVEMIQGCSHADICNIFENQSIVKFCINWAGQYPAYGDSTTQSPPPLVKDKDRKLPACSVTFIPLLQTLAANFLYKMSKIPEGRRYLNFNTKIAHDITSVLRKKDKILPNTVADVLQCTLALLKPNIDVLEADNTLYDYKPMREDMCNSTLQTLILHRRYMTFEEVLSHLNILINLSAPGIGVRNLIVKLKPMLNVFKRLAVDYDSFELNKAITRVLLNIILHVKGRQKASKPIEIPQSPTICILPPSHSALLNETKPRLPVSSFMNYINQSFNAPAKRNVRRVGRSKHKRCMKRKIISPQQRSPPIRPPMPPSRRSILNKVSIPKYRSSLDKIPIPKFRSSLKDIKEKD